MLTGLETNGGEVHTYTHTAGIVVKRTSAYTLTIVGRAGRGIDESSPGRPK